MKQVSKREKLYYILGYKQYAQGGLYVKYFSNGEDGILVDKKEIFVFIGGRIIENPRFGYEKLIKLTEKYFQ